VVGLVSLLGNAAGAVVLAGGDRANVNLEGVLRHTAADALGALGVVLAGLIVVTTGWNQADAVVSIAIAVLILLGSWRLLREPFNVLMETAPEGIDVQEVASAMCAVSGVREVHDLHVWTVTSGFAAVAAHVTVASSAEPSLVRRRMAEMLERHFGVTHSTLQVEREGAEHALLQIRRGDDAVGG
jgi:cobalt-zinc-cadmium efflux system protein